MQKTFDQIEIHDAHENNLKHIDVNIPKGQLVVFAGVSGSGKSSLLFDTLAVESHRQWQSSYPLYVRNKMPHYERPKVNAIYHLTPAIVVDQQAMGANARSTVGTAMDIAPLLRLLFSRVGQPSAGGSMAYSTHHPLGMCSDCTGLGERLVLDEERLFDRDKSLKEGAILFSQFSAGWQTYLYQANPLLNPDKKLRDFSEQEWKILREGSEQNIKVEIRSNNTGRVDKVDYEGVIPRFQRLYLSRDISKLKQSLQDEIHALVHQSHCPSCQGSGLNARALASLINGQNILYYQGLNATELVTELAKIQDPIGISLARQMIEQLSRMVEIGIGYLSLNRPTDTLSGGELQRLKMVRHLGSSLNNITYIFDEPTAGLHPADAERIGNLLQSLRQQQNNVLVVEHNRQMVALADHIIEMGIGAGSQGGNLIYQGNLQDLQQADTPTAKMLRQKIAINPAPLAWTEGFDIQNANKHNLKNVNVTIPKDILTAVTGVAGSGKSSLARYEFAERYPQAIVIDQKPIGTSIRSTPASYTGILDEIRKLFAKANGVEASWFSFNAKGGCSACKGTGQISYDMAFAEPVVVQCEECGGNRYNPTALSYRYQDKTIQDVLALTIEQAMNFFTQNKIRQPLQALLDVGLGYLTLGQPTSTLSGGEVQRVKLASELHKQGNIYILDEPSTGLHAQDIAQLLTLFRKMVANGNTVVMIEHRLELIAQADWVIDMGLEGGSLGGEVLFTGTPSELLNCKRSKTAEYLRKAVV